MCAAAEVAVHDSPATDVAALVAVHVLSRPSRDVASSTDTLRLPLTTQGSANSRCHDVTFG